MLHILSKRLELFCKACIAVLFVVMSSSAFLQVVSRFVFNNPLSWTEELSRYTMIWMTLLGAPLGVRYGAHITVDLVRTICPAPIQIGLHYLLNACVLAFAYVFVRYGFVYASSLFAQISPALIIPMGAIYMLIPVSGLLMAFFAVVNLADLRSGRSHDTDEDLEKLEVN